MISLYELLENDELNWEQVTLLIQNFVKLWKQKGGKDNVQENEKMANENEIDIQENNMSKHSMDTVSDVTMYSRTNFNEMEQYESTINIESKEISASTHIACNSELMKTLEIQNETINRHNNLSNEYYISPNRTFNSSRSLSFNSITTENISNKFEKCSTSDNLKCSFCAESQNDSIERICSITNNSSSSFIPSHDELLPIQMSMSSTISKSSKLYEYCLSNDDFEAFTISPNTN